MDPKTRERILIALKKSSSLADAEKRLSKADPTISRPTAWGLWDGFAGRPETTSGLFSDNFAETPAAVKMAREYRHARSVGREMAMCELPR